ncbi:endoplasmic reticulum membrane sensor NFE2L1-like isoform X1 [Diadema setosum]|uniref:endoplasmic reticulum membrane sensor NFE2L1-like isoform X1 n=1 Tax=Diadema setosum TaxID=31175 RepID=UPI003B3A404C
MIRKKLPYDAMLAIALMMSVLRVDWTDYMRDHLFVTHPRLQDSILGPSVGLTETQFHNLYNAAGVDLGQVHSKNIIRDSFYYNRSVFRELDSLYHGLPSVTNRSRVELQTFLLETLDSGSGHRTNGNAVAQPHPQNPTQLNPSVDQPMQDSDSDEGFEEMDTEIEGAVGQSPLSVSPVPSDELSFEDMDLIESLWRQDIDMGVCPDTYPYKGDIKPGFNDDLKKNINPWEYSIDGETGEFVPGPLPDGVQTAVQPQVPQQPQQPPNEPQETSLSLEDCLQLLEDEYSPDTAQTDLSPILTHQEAEQRWQDLATIPELQGSIPELLPNATTLNSSQGGYAAPQQHYMQAVTNGSSGLAPEVNDLSQTPRLNDVFAMNATTNGMVSLQNATQTHQQPLLMQNDTFGNFTNLNSPSHSSNASVASSDSNMTDFLMQALPQQLNQANASATYSPANLNMTDNSSSLLMELLNSPSAAQPLNPLDLDFDDQMQDVLAALDRDSLEDEDSDDSIFDESEGATGGYSSSSSEQDVFKGATGGYGVLRGHERQFGSDSSSNSYSSQPPKMENIKHNHSYAAPSQSQMQNGNGAQNSSYNGTNNNAFKSSRDEKRAKSLKLPMSVDKIINMPVDAFNDAIKKYELSDAQLQLIRDIRRRGKNKVAAQNCRKRKIDAINMVESTVGELRMERDKLVKERDSIDKEVSEMQQRYAELCEEVFSSIQDEHGGPVDPNDYTLQQMPDGTVFLVPRNGKWSSHRDRDEQSM